jgi:hypothetical protein
VEGGYNDRRNNIISVLSTVRRLLGSVLCDALLCDLRPEDSTPLAEKTARAVGAACFNLPQRPSGRASSDICPYALGQGA